MPYLEAIVALFAIVDPVGNIPMFMHVSEQVPEGQSQKAFNTAIFAGLVILILFSFAGNVVLEHIFHIELADLQLAGGILLLIIAVDHLVFGALKKTVSLEGNFTAHDIGCVPLACPLLAGPGAMVTCLTTLETSGPGPAIVAILVIFGLLRLIMYFVEPIHKFLGRLICTVFSKVMCLFIAAIGVHLIISGLLFYFK